LLFEGYRVPVRTHVYVDGFNLYCGATKGTPYKWLNIKELVRQLIPADHDINKIKYFTARVSGAHDPDTPRRQAIYLNALRSIPEMEIHFGNFLSKTIWRPVMNLPVGGHTIGCPTPAVLPIGTHAVALLREQLIVGNYPPRGQARPNNATLAPLPDSVKVEVHTMEEKGSDVNLAVHLLNDAWKDLYDAAVVLSVDTDLTAPIRMVTQERRKVVYLCAPARRPPSRKLTTVSTYIRHIHRANLARAQLPDPIPGTTIRKPPSW